MHDEAACHYIDMIDQTTLGHCFIREHFNKTPRAGWRIDPFGNPAVQTYILGAEVQLRHLISLLLLANDIVQCHLYKWVIIDFETALLLRSIYFVCRLVLILYTLQGLIIRRGSHEKIIELLKLYGVDQILLVALLRLTIFLL